MTKRAILEPQHIDAVLIYEIISEAKEKSLPTAVAVWTGTFS